MARETIPASRGVPSRAWRAARSGYRIALLATLLLLALELGLRLVQELRGSPTFADRLEVPGAHSLHPFFQTAHAVGGDVRSGARLPHWLVLPSSDRPEGSSARVLILGGSTFANDAPRQVGHLLKTEGGIHNYVYNLAFDWHTSLHSLHKFWSYCDAVQPDLVVVKHAINDFSRGFTPP